MAAESRLFFKLHNGFPEHPKTIELSDKAFRQLIEAWCYCSRMMNDGKLTKSLFLKLFSRKTQKELLSVGYVVETENGYEMHDYLAHQMSAKDVEDLRNKRAEAGSRGGKARANNQATAKANASDLPKQTASKPVADIDVDVDVDKSFKRSSPPATPSGGRFAEFWEWYPRKVGKPDAQAAYKKAIRKHDEQAILDGIERYRLDPNLPAAKFIPYPATWLNREGWNDPPCAEQNVVEINTRQTHADRANAEAARMLAQLNGNPQQPTQLAIGTDSWI